MYCAEQIRLGTFINVPNLTMHKWLLNHCLTTSECNHKGCTSNCNVIADGDGVALKCRSCHYVSKGANRSFWRMGLGKLPTVKMVLLVFAIVSGLPLSTVHQVMDINKNTWSTFIQDVGIVLGEALERNRRVSSVGRDCFWQEKI